MISLAQTITSKYFTKIAYIRKLPNGKYRVFSEKGKNMGTYDSREGAKKRLREIEFFKYQADDGKAATAKEEETYSSMLRKLHKEGNEAKTKLFLTAFKDAFDKLVLAGEEEPAEKALPIAMFILARAK